MSEPGPPPPPPGEPLPAPPRPAVPPPPESGAGAPPAPAFTVSHPRRRGDPDPGAERTWEPVDGTPRSERRRALRYVLGGAVLVVALVAVVALVGRRGSDNDAEAGTPTRRVKSPEPTDGASATGPVVPVNTSSPQPATSPPATASATTLPPTTLPPTTLVPTTTSPSTTVSPSPPPDPEAVALQQLQTLIASDAPTVASVAEHWVPQLGAKQLGTVWQGVTYDYQHILAEHQQLHDLYGAVLVDGASYNFRIDGEPMTGWFITLVPQAYSDPDGALAWCTAQRIDRDDCFAKLLTQNQDAGPTIRLND